MLDDIRGGSPQGLPRLPDVTGGSGESGIGLLDYLLGP
jgi:hypothetical protein